MPLLAYFAVVGTVLTGLMFWADAKFEKPAELAFSTPSIVVPQGASAASTERTPEAFWAAAPDSAFVENARFASAEAETKTLAQQPVAAADEKRPASASAEARRAAEPRRRVASKPRERDVAELERDRMVEMRRERYARSGFFGLSIW